MAELIGRTHLFGLEDRYSRTLSGGEQQRVALARALAIEPEALFLMNRCQRSTRTCEARWKYSSRKRLAYRRPTLLVTHNMEEAYRLGARLLVCREGGWSRGAKERIFQRPPSVDGAIDGLQEYFAGAHHFGSQRRSTRLGLHSARGASRCAGEWVRGYSRPSHRSRAVRFAILDEE